MTTLSPEQEAREAIILRSVQEATGMLRKFARIYHLELEDLQQDAAVIALETVDKAVHTQNPQAYIHRAIRNRTFDQVTRKLAVSVTSLDIPYFVDTLADSVAASDDHRRRELITCAIHDALHRLPTLEQELLAATYGLHAFLPKPGIPLDKRALPNTKPRWRRSSIMRKLRRNKQLQATLEAVRKSLQEVQA